MSANPHPSPLPWLDPGDDFPEPQSAWGETDPLPGLLAAGGALDTPTLLKAYAQGIFPWYSAGQPTLWWSPDPRMVLRPQAFKLHRSLRKTLKQLLERGRLEIRFDDGFRQVMQACATSQRPGQNGTWIQPEMVQAYTALHAAGHAHSVETWIDGELVGGLYAVNIGHMVFGESMFSRRSDASKIALAALVCFAWAHGIDLIDCQQDTAHLQSLGGELVSREDLLAHIERQRHKAEPHWRFDPVYWNLFFPDHRFSA